MELFFSNYYLANQIWVRDWLQLQSMFWLIYIKASNNYCNFSTFGLISTKLTTFYQIENGQTGNISFLCVYIPKQHWKLTCTAAVTLLDLWNRRYLTIRAKQLLRLQTAILYRSWEKCPEFSYVQNMVHLRLNMMTVWLYYQTKCCGTDKWYVFAEVVKEDEDIS